MIETKNLTKIYKMSKDVAVRALDKVNLTVEKGEFLAIMGSSGSGKSTLLHMIAGVDVPTSGSVLIEGVDIHKLSPARQAEFRRRKVGIIYQSYNLIPTLTVEENIILPRLLDRKPPAKEQVEELLELLQLKDRRKHLPSQLSGGQQQRTAIGRVLLESACYICFALPAGYLLGIFLFQAARGLIDGLLASLEEFPPIRLAISVLFSIALLLCAALIILGSGFLPAVKAAKISPMELLNTPFSQNWR